MAKQGGNSAIWNNLAPLSVPIQTPMFMEDQADGGGISKHLSRTWIIFFERLAQTLGVSTTTNAGNTTSITNNDNPGPFIRTFLPIDTATGTNVGPNVVSFGAKVEQQSIVRRVSATLRKAITSDLTVKFRVVLPDTTIQTLGTFTIPHTTAVDVPVKWTPPNAAFVNTGLPDMSVFIPDILASDASADKNGIAAYTIEWVGRGAGAPTATGLVFLGAWDSSSTYSKGDMVTYSNALYVSLQDANTNNEPDTSPTFWSLIVEGVSGAGTVTHTGGALTADLPLFGAGGADIKTGTKSGTTDEVATVSGSTTNGHLASWDGSGNLVDGGVAASGTVTGSSLTANLPVIGAGGTAIAVGTRSGDTTEFATVTGSVTSGHMATWDASGNLADGGAPGGTGTVTHTGGALTANLPVFGAGSADIKVGTKSGNTNEVATVSGSVTTGNLATWDASGNLVDGGAPGAGGNVTTSATLTSGLPIIGNGGVDVAVGTRSGNTTKYATVSGSVTSADIAVWDAAGNLVDGGAANTFVGHSGGNLTADLPVFGNGTNDVKVGTKSGNTNEVATVTGSVTNGHIATWDASGNLVDGGTIGGGGGAASQDVTHTSGIVSPFSPPTSGWSWVNQGTASINTVDSALCMNIPDNASLNWRLRVRPVSGTYTITAHLRYVNQAANSQDGGIYLYDSGSGKIKGLELLTQAGSPGQFLRVEKANSATSDNATLVSVTVFYPYITNMYGLLSLRIIEDGTHTTFQYSLDCGLNWKQIWQEASGTFLTADNVGFGGLSIVNDPAHYVDVSLLSWTGA